MIIALVSPFHVYLPWDQCLCLVSNQPGEEENLVGAFSVIVKTDCETDGSRLQLYCRAGCTVCYGVQYGGRSSGAINPAVSSLCWLDSAFFKNSNHFIEQSTLPPAGHYMLPSSWQLNIYFQWFFLLQVCSTFQIRSVGTEIKFVD